MINVQSLFKAGMASASSNAPALLTAFGAVGAVGTAILAGKASFEAAGNIREATIDNNLDIEEGEDLVLLTRQEQFKLVWPLYVPAVTSGVFTVSAIVLAHRVSSKRAAVIAAAYALNEGKLEEYQEKVKEKFGVKKETEVRDEIAQDRVDHDYHEGTVIFSPLDGKVLIRDEYSGRFFWSSIEEVNKAVNEANQELLINNSVTLSEFYDTLGLEHVSTSDYVGWNTRNRVEVNWSTCTTPDKSKAVHSFEFVNEPMLNPGSNASF